MTLWEAESREHSSQSDAADCRPRSLCTSHASTSQTDQESPSAAHPALPRLGGSVWTRQSPGQTTARCQKPQPLQLRASLGHLEDLKQNTGRVRHSSVWALGSTPGPKYREGGRQKSGRHTGKTRANSGERWLRFGAGGHSWGSGGQWQAPEAFPGARPGSLSELELLASRTGRRKGPEVGTLP